jgi:predicted ribosome quality control (RQC) complex YloA/Tae2 family protein
MKRSLSGLDLVAMTKELQAIVDARIDKVYQPRRDEIEISLASKGAGKLRLRIKLTGWIWLGKPTEDMPASPTSFASQLRKHISNARVIEVSQHGCDRIIELSLQKDEDSRLIIELFGEGNLILVKDGVIAALFRRRKMKHRDLKPKGAYDYPPATIDPRTVGKEAFLETLKASNADIVRTLATRINLGGDYAEEVCLRAGVDKGAKIAAMDATSLGRVWSEIGLLVGRLETEAAPHITIKEGAMTGVSPIGMRTDSGMEAKAFPTLSAAIEVYLASLPETKEKGEESDPERTRLDRTLATQREALLRLGPEIEEAQRSAEFIFANYAKIEAMLAGVKESVAEKKELPEGAEIVDRAKGRFKAAFGDLNLVLSWKKDVTGNAQEFYDAVKKLKGKLEGVDDAIKDTEVKIEAMLAKSASEKKEKAAKTGKARNLEWFERYRWFISSEGALVIAGKDAKSNDQLVKKHLQPGDRYIHADIHGAPSVVVKKKEGMTEATLREAATFSLAMSKAWNAGIGSGSAYWVTPEQVSKTPESGEFLAKGAWIVRGKRNYFDGLELRLAIGRCEAGRGSKAMCAPVTAVARNCKEYIEIVPGSIPKETASKELAARFSVSIDEIQSILPPGGVKFAAENKG